MFFAILQLELLSLFLQDFFLCLIWGPQFIEKLKENHFGQNIRDDGPASHKKKAGTPTMGGWLILLSTVIPILLWIDLMNPLVVATIFITWCFGIIGYIDDYLKVSIKKIQKAYQVKFACLENFLYQELLYLF